MTEGIYEPSPEAIRKGCEEIRSKWTPKQRKQRWWGGKPRRIETQIVKVSDLPDQVAGWIESINDEREVL